MTAPTISHTVFHEAMTTNTLDMYYFLGFRGILNIMDVYLITMRQVYTYYTIICTIEIKFEY